MPRSAATSAIAGPARSNRLTTTATAYANPIDGRYVKRSAASVRPMEAIGNDTATVTMKKNRANPIVGVNRTVHAVIATMTSTESGASQSSSVNEVGYG